MGLQSATLQRFAHVLAISVLLLGWAGCRQWGPDGNADGCVKCHKGIEKAHPEISEKRCSLCHGGDPTSVDQDLAHVPIPADWADIRGALPPSPPGFIRDFAPEQLDAIDPDYLKFINPSDIRVVQETCGASGCHEDHARTMPNSVMATNVGHYFPTMYLAGLLDVPQPVSGSVAATDSECDLSIEGTVCDLGAFGPLDNDEVMALFSEGVPEQTDLLDMAYRSYLSKSCTVCHQSGFPKNNSPKSARPAAKHWGKISYASEIAPSPR